MQWQGHKFWAKFLGRPITTPHSVTLLARRFKKNTCESGYVLTEQKLDKVDERLKIA